MSDKTIKILYWTLTLLFCLAMLMDAIGGLTQQEAGKEALRHLGYPMYLLTISGVAKITGVVSILQTRYKTIKEWAFAGFTISFICAFWSRAYVGDGISLLIPPMVMLVIMFLTYYLWKRFELIRSK